MRRCEIYYKTAIIKSQQSIGLGGDKVCIVPSPKQADYGDGNPLYISIMSEDPPQMAAVIGQPRHYST
ncbi:hypothetical protein GZH53_03800 [Flavihumibacter sp. R14]|nr:hypothetical protein [Flavihumibacter soli]